MPASLYFVNRVFGIFVVVAVEENVFEAICDIGCLIDHSHVWKNR